MLDPLNFLLMCVGILISTWKRVFLNMNFTTSSLEYRKIWSLRMLSEKSISFASSGVLSSVPDWNCSLCALRRHSLAQSDHYVLFGSYEIYQSTVLLRGLYYGRLLLKTLTIFTIYRQIQMHINTAQSDWGYNESSMYSQRFSREVSKDKC